jgi:ribosomal protein S10
MSLARKGKTFSETHKLNLSKSKLGEKNPFYGKHHSEDFKRERSKRVIEISDSGEILRTFDSIGIAKESLGVCRKSLCKFIKSR